MKPRPSQSDLSTNVTRMDERINVLEASVGSLVMKIDGLAQTLNTSQRTNWPLIIAGLSILFVIVGGAWQVIELKTQVALAPVLAQNAISTEERQALFRQTDDNKRGLSTLASEVGRVFEKFREVEGQFKKLGDAHNTFVADQCRTNKVVWEATGKLGEYPSGPFYFPSFSQHLPTE